MFMVEKKSNEWVYTVMRDKYIKKCPNKFLLSCHINDLILHALSLIMINKGYI